MRTGTGYDGAMSITSVLPLLAVVALVGLLLAIFVGGAVYVMRLKRNGTEATLVGARKHRELR